MVVVATASSGDGCARAREGERAEEGRSTGESERGSGRYVAAPGASPVSAEAGGGHGVWLRAASMRSASFWRGRDDDWRRPVGLGRTVLGHSWAGKLQVSAR